MPNCRSPLARLVAAALALALAGGTAVAQPAPGGGGRGPGGAAQGPKSVGTVTAELSDVPQVVTLPGRAVAYEVASVRPRVGGLVEEITYEPGRIIEAGAPMFRLETATLSAALDAARATELGATQARDNARTTVERYQALENRGVTRADLQAAEVALTQAEAELATAQVNRQTAELEVERAVIPAPITGYTSETSATIGSLVTANQADALATVTRIDPIYVDVAASSARILAGRRQVSTGVVTRMDPPKIEVTLEDGTPYEAAGEIVSAGSTVSPTTGTLDLRVRFANPDRMILPGQFLRVNMTIGTIRAVLVPQRATTRLADGSLAVFVLKDGRAVRRTLTEVGVSNNAWAVSQGVEAGDSVIVDGLANLNDGQAVSAVAVTLDDSGVVVPATSADTKPWAAPAPANGTAGGTAGAAAATASEQRPGWWARLRAAVGFGDEGSATPEGAPAGGASAPASAPAAAPAPATASAPATAPAGAPAPAPALASAPAPAPAPATASDTTAIGTPGAAEVTGPVRTADPMAAPEGTAATPASTSADGAGTGPASGVSEAGPAATPAAAPAPAPATGPASPGAAPAAAPSAAAGQG